MSSPSVSSSGLLTSPSMVSFQASGSLVGLRHLSVVADEELGCGRRVVVEQLLGRLRHQRLVAEQDQAAVLAGELQQLRTLGAGAALALRRRILLGLLRQGRRDQPARHARHRRRSGRRPPRSWRPRRSRRGSHAAIRRCGARTRRRRHAPGRPDEFASWFARSCSLRPLPDDRDFVMATRRPPELFDPRTKEPGIVRFATRGRCERRHRLLLGGALLLGRLPAARLYHFISSQPHSSTNKVQTICMTISVGCGRCRSSGRACRGKGRLTGSSISSSPAIQPSSPAPAQTRMGNLCSRAMIRVAPATISGIETSRPKPISQGCPFAAAAMASTLSRLMTMSAIATVRTAPQSVSELATRVLGRLRPAPAA